MSPSAESTHHCATSVTVVVPAYNEEKLLAPLVESLVRSMNALLMIYEIVVVNDGSHDRTPIIADDLAGRYPHVSVIHQENKGIGGAVKAGIDRASLEYLLFWPVDMRGDVEDIRPYLSHIGEADVIVGCRKRRVGYNLLMRLNAWLYPYLVRMLFGLQLRDCNWIHLYRTRFIKKIHLSQTGIPMLAEILVKIRDLGGTFLEIDVDMSPRKIGVPSAARFRVMGRTFVGLFTAWINWRRDRAQEIHQQSRVESQLAQSIRRNRSGGVWRL